jgi:hypothetical protein
MRKAVESPEWTSLYWAVMAIVGLVILNSLLSCTPEPTPYIKRTEDYLADYWFLGVVPTAILGLITWKLKSPFPKTALALMTLTSFCIWVMPYCLMFALWVMTELIP